MNAVEDLHEELALHEERHGAAALLVDTLSPAEAERVATLLAAARRIESADVAVAVDAMVAAIPSVVRGRVRKVLQRDEC